MKVLKKGRTQKGWASTEICTGRGNGMGGCGAKLLVESGDVFCTYRSFYDGSNDTYHTFKCSECGVLTDFSKHVPFDPPSEKEWLKSKALDASQR